MMATSGRDKSGPYKTGDKSRFSVQYEYGFDEYYV